MCITADETTCDVAHPTPLFPPCKSTVFFAFTLNQKKNIRNCDISSTDSQKIALNRCFNGGTTKHNLRRLLLCSTKSEFDSPARKNTGLRIPEPHIRPVHSAMFLVDSHSGRPAKPIADVYFLRKTRLLTLKKYEQTFCIATFSLFFRAAPSIRSDRRSRCGGLDRGREPRRLCGPRSICCPRRVRDGQRDDFPRS